MKVSLSLSVHRMLLIAIKVNSDVSGYKFFPTADKAQDAIWRYSVDTHGKKQAIKYIEGLHAHIQTLSEKKKMWWPLPDKFIIPSDLNMITYFSRYEHHNLFFRELPSGKIGIMSILHESTDMPVRLLKDLRRIMDAISAKRTL